jgi:DNA-binding NarL/FixJ family response regulator
MPSRSRILIADDHILVADLCKKLLESEFDVVGTVSDGRAMVQAAIELKPHAIVVDIAMPVLNGLDAGQQVKASCKGVKLVYLTMNPDAGLASEAFRRGASAYLLKTCAASELVTGLRAVLRGETYMSKGLPKHTIEDLLRSGRDSSEDPLTPREREVLQLLAEGKCMKEIGYTLHISTRTVGFHKYRIMDVLRLRSNAELVRYAVQKHLVAA